MWPTGDRGDHNGALIMISVKGVYTLNMNDKREDNVSTSEQHDSQTKDHHRWDKYFSDR